MKHFLQPDVPASAKVLSLVRHHHGLPAGAGDEIPVSSIMRSNRLARIWRTGARLNHLNARRRRIELDDIPANAFPVVLELGQGSQFLILREKLTDHGTESFLVQFPDARESLVRAERIREIYDGTCVFLRPRDAANDERGLKSCRGWVARLRLRIASFSMKRGVIAAITCHVLTLAGVLGMVVSHRLAFPASGADSLLVPAVGVFMAAAVVMGILRLRREVITERFPAALVDGVFVPIYALAMVFLAGWVATPFFWVAGSIIAVLLLSARLGQVPSRLRAVRGYVVGGTFFAGAVACWTVASLGIFPPAVMAGALVLGTCLVNLLIESDVLWQEVRLAMIAG
jgi:hypothetical protein